MESGYQDREQSEIKHYAIKLYLEAAARILGAAWNLKYVDCCAGPWQSTKEDYSDTSFGIALQVLRATVKDLSLRKRVPIVECLFIEKNKKSYAELAKFANSQDGPEIRVRAENWDFVDRIEDIVRYCSSQRTFSFILIDPKGWKLAGISQISPLLKLKPGEVVINLMSSFITRFLDDGSTDFTDLLGEDFPELRTLRGAQREFAVIRKYCDLVKRDGHFKYVCALPVMKPDTDAFNFYLIYGTRHPKGVEVFKQVEKRTEKRTHVVRSSVQKRLRQERSHNLELFDPNVLYTENRYKQLVADNKEMAKRRVLEILQEAGRATYDECWAEALQYSAVYQDDLRLWLSGWETNGTIAVKGRKFPTEVLKRDCGHEIQYGPNRT